MQDSRCFLWTVGVKKCVNHLSLVEILPMGIRNMAQPDLKQGISHVWTFLRDKKRAGHMLQEWYLLSNDSADILFDALSIGPFYLWFSLTLLQVTGEKMIGVFTSEVVFRTHGIWNPFREGLFLGLLLTKIFQMCFFDICIDVFMPEWPAPLQAKWAVSSAEQLTQAWSLGIYRHGGPGAGLCGFLFITIHYILHYIFSSKDSPWNIIVLFWRCALSYGILLLDQNFKNGAAMVHHLFIDQYQALVVLNIAEANEEYFWQQISYLALKLLCAVYGGQRQTHMVPQFRD